MTVSIYEFTPLPDETEQYPVEYIEANGVIKLRETEDAVTIGVCDDVDDLVMERLGLYHRKSISVCRIDRRELSAFLGRRLAGEPFEGLPASGSGDERLLLDKLANDAPIVNLVNSLLIEAIRHDASDLHLESYADRAVVRYRIDGSLRVVGAIRPAQFAAVSSRIKIMANLNIMERRLPQDGRISVHLSGKPFDLRVSIMPVTHGESIVLRLFQKTGTVMTLDELGLSADHVKAIRTTVAIPHGLFLITGPTGSGKTTTLTAILQEIRSEERKIITIEDPVEYLIDGTNQIPTNEQIGLTFDSLLRRVVRQDPNVIMVGEIRDSPTAELAVRAAQTGRIVLSTLHTNNAVSAVARLLNMGIEAYLIAGVLRAVMAQRLVRRVCTGCSEAVKPTPSQKAALDAFGIRSMSLRQGGGCERCGGTGYRGRIAVSELFTCDLEIERMISSGAGTRDLAGLLARGGIRTLLEDGYRKAAGGLTTIAEVESVAAA